MLSIYWGKVILGCTTHGTYPIGGERFKGGSWLYAPILVTFCGVIDIPAYITYILLHGVLLIKLLWTPLKLQF
jgi:hypothetical protein